jgi:orotate phosphoribosyltransferase
MDDAAILKEFEDSRAILKGHFVLSSGLHSDTYLQCARVLTDPARGERIARALAEKVRARVLSPIDLVVSPAMGGVVIGYLVAQALRVPSIFCERVNGAFAFRRGFEIGKGASVLVVEDVVTTGLSSRETFACIRAHGGGIVAEACIADRAGIDDIDGIPLVSLFRPQINVYEEASLPESLRSVPVYAPGSRFLKG